MKNFTLIFLCFLLCATHKLSAQFSIYGEAYGSGITFEAFGGSINSITEDATVAYTGSKSLKIDVPAGGYTGGALKTATPQNLSTYTAVSFWVKASAAKTLNVSGLGNNATTTVYSVELQNVAVTTTWTKVVIAMPNPAKLTAESGLFHFAEGSDQGAYTLWLDDIQYENIAVGSATAAMATETITKSIGDSFSPNGATCSFNGVNLVITKAWFNYTSSNTGVATMNNATGIGTAAGAGTTNITATMGATAVTGTLTVNVTAAPSGPTVAAPTPPVRATGDVISVFSDAYTNLAGTDFFPNWGQTTVVSDVSIAGNATKQYATFNYEGTQLAASTNVSAMTHFHIDFWSSTVTTFDVFLITTGAGGGEQTVTRTTTLSGWNSLDIPLSSYAAPVNLSNIGQIKLVGTPSSGTVYLDNIYFYKSAVVAPTAPTVAAPTPTKLPANVISLFSNAYTDVAGTDWFPNWGQATVVTDEMIASNTTKKYATLNYQGVQFASPINAATMMNLHIDYWSSTVNSFDVFLINIPPLTQREQAVTLTPTLSGWNSIDIPLSSYGTIDLASIGQFKLEGRPSGGTVYLDNIYFWKAPVVPVELVNFKGKAANNTTVLTWKTASERNNQGFTIERSNDGTTYAAIGQVKGNGTTNAAHDYTFTDNTPSVNINYYRLRQTDFDGKETVSPVVAVLFGKGGLVVRNTLATNAVELVVGDATPVTVSIFNVSGQQMYASKIQGTQQIDVSAWVSGLYVVRTSTGEVSRFVKQ